MDMPADGGYGVESSEPKPDASIRIEMSVDGEYYYSLVRREAGKITLDASGIPATLIGICSDVAHRMQYGNL